MITVSDLTLVLNKRTILEHINAEFAAGEIHGLVGRNGSGKTMLMKCVSGFIRPTSGGVLVEGWSTAGKNGFPESMGLILESPGFLPYASGFRNLSMLAELNKKISAPQIRAAMERVGLDPDLRLRVAHYSLGMRQRLGLAQAIMEDPKLLVLDEPFNGLDEQGVEDIRKLLLELKNQGKTILLSSHNSEDIDILCDHVYYMERGHISQVR